MASDPTTPTPTPDEWATAHEVARQWLEHGAEYMSTGPHETPVLTDGLVRLVAAAIASAVEAERAWRDMDSAPKDGTEVLLFAHGDIDYTAVGQWSDNTELPGTVAGWFWPFAIRPTSWQPLPPPPRKGGPTT